MTFLLTDIEGSTDCSQRLDDEYAGVLAEVRRRVGAAVRQGGRERGRRPAMTCSRCSSGPPRGRRSAGDTARNAGRGWPGGNQARLRVGLHRGRPALTETGYVGLSVHAAARICFAAHGGQIVMSAAVRAAIRDSLPDGMGLTGLGAWRFRGLPEPLDMFQVVAAGLLEGLPAAAPAVAVE